MGKWALLLTFLFHMMAVASPMEETLSVPRGRLRFLWQNDSWFTESDRFYTNGIGLGWTLLHGARANRLENSLAWLPFGLKEYGGAESEFFVRQDMFTPEDFTNPLLLVNDRPYAGWLHLDFTHHRLTLAEHGTGPPDRLDTWEVQIGVVGPTARAEEAQREVHEIVGAEIPRGWHHQLHDEPGVTDN